MKSITIFLFSFFSILGWSQNGQYHGTIELPGLDLEVNLHIQQDKEAFTGTLDIPMQNAVGLNLEAFEKKGDSLYFEAPEIPGEAFFMVIHRQDSLLGRFTQMNKTFPFSAVKVEKSPQFSVDSLKNELQNLLDKTGVAGMSVGIIYKGEVILNQGFGYADIENKRKVDENTVFAIGSCSKAFTAALLSKCEEDGLISWDEPVSPYLKGFGMKDPDARNINSEDLLTHRSGLPRHDLIWYGSGLSRDQLIKKISLLDHTEPFRTKFQYQNLMYMTAGVLAGELRNQTWETLLQEQIFDPLDMSSSTSHLEGLTNAKNKALPYRIKDKANSLMPYRNIDAIGPAGSINSTSTDMLKWVKMLLNRGKYGPNSEHILLLKGSVNKMTSPIINMGSTSTSKDIGTMFYGMGWMINDYKTKKMVHHGGNIDGFSANVMFMPHDELGVVILTNANGTSLTTMASFTIADMVLGLKSTDWYGFMNPYGEDKSDDTEKESDSKKGKKASKKDAPIDHYFEIKEYAGTYENEVYGSIDIRLSNDSLLMNYNSFNYLLRHQKMEIFSALELTYEESQNIIFRTDMNGDLSHLEFDLESNLPPYKFTKKASEQLLSEKYLEQFVGDYLLDNIEINMFLREGWLWAKVKGQGEFQLIPKSTNKFKLAEMENFGVEFLLDRKGSVTGIITHQPNGDFEGKKL